MMSRWAKAVHGTFGASIFGARGLREAPKKRRFDRLQRRSAGQGWLSSLARPAGRSAEPGWRAAL
jgi:hypothetical protein